MSDTGYGSNPWGLFIQQQMILLLASDYGHWVGSYGDPVACVDAALAFYNTAWPYILDQPI